MYSPIDITINRFVFEKTLWYIKWTRYRRRIFSRKFIKLIKIAPVFKPKVQQLFTVSSDILSSCFSRRTKFMCVCMREFVVAFMLNLQFWREWNNLMWNFYFNFFFLNHILTVLLRQFQKIYRQKCNNFIKSTFSLSKWRNKLKPKIVRDPRTNERKVSTLDWIKLVGHLNLH